MIWVECVCKHKLIKNEDLSILWYALHNMSIHYIMSNNLFLKNILWLIIIAICFSKLSLNYLESVGCHMTRSHFVY
jgi:hypothetical protein